jgi:hypothetical protein
MYAAAVWTLERERRAWAIHYAEATLWDKADNPTWNQPFAVPAPIVPNNRPIMESDDPALKREMALQGLDPRRFEWRKSALQNTDGSFKPMPGFDIPVYNADGSRYIPPGDKTAPPIPTLRLRAP